MRRSRVVVSSLALMLMAGVSRAQVGVGSAFTYQGQLSVSGALANGAYDIQFRLLDAASGGAQVGSPIVASNVSVSKGLFTRQLDFGAGAFNGSMRWLELAVRPAGSGSYTTLAPLQPLTASPYALGLSLPCSETAATGSTMLNLTQTAANSAGAIAGSVLNGPGTAVYGQASGPGAIGVWGYHLSGSGSAGYFRNESSSNTSPALRVESNGGPAGDFQVQGLFDSGSAVSASTGGTGHAGSFVVSNAANSASALAASTVGSGDAVSGLATGTGRAGYFVTINAANAAPALEAYTTGSGPAGKFTGDVVVNGNESVAGNLDVVGAVTAKFGSGGQHRATPIAYGTFTLSSGALLAGSGNVTVTPLANSIYRVNVLGESTPTSWCVQANLVYTNPGAPDHIHDIRVGVPNASGQIQIAAPCISGCGVFTTQDVQVHFAVYRP